MIIEPDQYGDPLIKGIFSTLAKAVEGVAKLRLIQLGWGSPYIEEALMDAEGVQAPSAGAVDGTVAFYSLSGHPFCRSHRGDEPLAV